MRSSPDETPVGTLHAALLAPTEAIVGESPLWDQRDETLWWTDLATGVLYGASADGSHLRRRAIGKPLGGIALGAEGGLIAAVGDRVASVSPARSQPIADLGLAGRRLRVNDAACDPGGRLWVSVVGLDGQPGSLHRVSRGRARLVRDGLAFPNGLDWSPRGEHLYLAESHGRRVSRFEFDPGNGRLGRRETFIQLPGGDGLPDGIAVDESGGIWVAIWGSGEVRRYSPGGELMARVQCPVSQVSSCGFGGGDRRTLYLTSAREGLDRRALKAQPLAGSLFRVRVPQAGQRPRFYAAR
jgi:sugar lactone lactonase YvrE